MLNFNSVDALLSNSLATAPDPELQKRLGLYQVFLRLYEHNRGLLDEILSLESSSCKSLAMVSIPYIQGIVTEDKAYLVTNLLGGETQALHQPEQVWIIGRDSSQVMLPICDKRLSRCHACIRYDGHHFYLIDLASSNGSFVNGEMIRHAVPLRDGDRIRLGSLTIVFFICKTSQVLDSLTEEQQHLIDQAKLPGGAIAKKADGDDTCPLESEDDLEAINPLEDTLMFLKSVL